MDIKQLKTRGDASNCYLVTDASGEAVLIDASVAPEILRNALDEIGATLKYILLTHAHFDHMYYLTELARMTGAKVALGAPDRASLASPRGNLSSYFCATPLAFDGVATALSEGDVIRFGDSSLEVGIYPGHTPGLACYFGDGVAFTGDLLFRGSVGRSDFPGSSPDDMICSLARIYEWDKDTKIYPGHGDGTVLAYEFDNNYFLREAAALAAEYNGRDKN